MSTFLKSWYMLNQWEYSHAARALLQIAALAAFVCSLLMEIPSANARKH